MPELSLLEIIKYTIKSLAHSKVLILLILEIAILLISLIFSKLMNKKVVKSTSVLASLIVFGMYVSNYVDTVITFINNVSTRLMEFLYFPTTLEFMIVMLISFLIMFATLLNKDSKLISKLINSSFAIGISFIFLCIIEYINTNSIPFDEYSVFTNPILMSLYELAMGIFITWILGLLVIKIDIILINALNKKPVIEKNPKIFKLDIPALKRKNEIELPKLKSEL